MAKNSELSSRPPSDQKRYRPVSARAVTLNVPGDNLSLDWITISVVREGAAIIAYDFGSRRVERDDVVLLVPGTVVEVQPRDSITFGLIALDCDWLIDVVFWRYADVFTDRLQARRHVQSWRTPPIRFGRVNAEQAVSLATWIDELTDLTGTETAPDQFFQVQIVAFAILDVLAVVFGADTPRLPTPAHGTKGQAMPSLPRRRPLALLRPELWNVADLMRFHPAEHWTLALLAAQAHLSPSWFAHVFDQAFGKPPITFLTMVRVEKLAHLLCTTHDSVVACAHAVGWASASHAAKQFRRTTGMTPREYRKLAARPTESASPN